MTDDERRTCPGCGAKPRKDRYPAHVEACTGDPPRIGWYWNGSWRDKLNVIVVTLTVIVLSYVAAIYNAIEEAYEEAKDK